MKKPPVITEVQRALNDWLEAQNAHTRRAYDADLRAFAAALKQEHSAAAVLELVSMGRAAAAKRVQKYLAGMLGRNPLTTIRRRSSSIRGAVTALCRAELIDWALEVDLPKPKTKEQAKAAQSRNMEGIDLLELNRLRERLDADGSRRGLRDRAIIELMAGPPYLRRSEVVQLNVEDVNLRKRRVTVIGKGRIESEELTLSPIAAEALAKWLSVRKGTRSSPLFPRLDRAADREERLTDHSVWKLARRRGWEAGLEKVRPHGLRHHGITELANLVDAKGLPVGEGMKLSRHRKEDTYRGYIDRTGRLQDQIVAELAARSLEKSKRP